MNYSYRFGPLFWSNDSKANQPQINESKSYGTKKFIQ